MRRRGGRGAALAFDVELAERIEKMKVKIGYYPTLREIGLSFTPPYSHSHVFNRLQLLASEGRLSAGMAEVYKAKTQREKENNGKPKDVKTVGQKSSGKKAGTKSKVKK
jgi:hypothetical protein